MKYCIILLVFLFGCQAAEFVVVSKKPTGVYDNCIIEMKPITKKAEHIVRFGNAGALVGCDNVNVGDTLIVNRKTFTNY